jgi:hypothetical protein
VLVWRYQRSVRGQGTARAILIPVNIVVLSVPDCPNMKRMLDVVREATSGRTDATIESRVVDVSKPMPAGFSGSPTVLIDGQNLSGAPAISDPACSAVLPSLAQIREWIR